MLRMEKCDGEFSTQAELNHTYVKCVGWENSMVNIVNFGGMCINVYNASRLVYQHQFSDV
jgi:hypothetical protein